MRVAVTMRAVRDPATGEMRDAIARDVIAWLGSFGAVPILIPNGMREVADMARDAGVEGVILTGGNDLGADAARDRTEALLLRMAVAHRLPVFGVCRGMQMIARYFGGDDVVPIEPAKAHVGRHDVQLHPAMATFAAIPSGVVTTNSYHDLGVQAGALPDEVETLATSHDGWVEALRHCELPIVGVQWHPERTGSCTAVDAALVDRWLAWCAKPSAAGARA